MLNSDGKPIKGDEEALNCTEEALKGDVKGRRTNIKVDPKALKGNERR